MEEIWAVIAQALALVLGSLSALLMQKVAGYKKEAERQSAVIEKIGNKADSIVPLLMAMLTAEQELDGFEQGCGRCGRDAATCSPAAHEAEKKDRVMKLMQKWHRDDGSEFDFAFLDAKYNELMFSLTKCRG